MTFKKLKQVIEKNNIPEDVTLMSDSGWECGPTQMNGVYYNEDEKVIVFTQEEDDYDGYYTSSLWKLLYSLDDERSELTEE
jgi:hypothetical protein